MSTGQIIILGVGLLIVLSSVDFSSLFKAIKNSLPKQNPSIKPVINVEAVENSKEDLVEVVKKWDDLKDTCESLGLKEAVDKLNEIFPMLIKVDKWTID